MDVDLHGDVKSFFQAALPYAPAPFPASSQGVFDVRLKGTAEAGAFSAEVHHVATALSGAAIGVTSTGLGLTAPEAVDLSWVAHDADPTVRGRVDRLVVRATRPGLEAAFGRQAISFGTGLFFTPLDLVNPFNPAVVDQEYKPGVDAARIDVFPSMTSKITAVGAYAGDWTLDGAVLALSGQGTLGVTDLGGFAGSIHADAVFGATVATSVGAFGLHGDAAVTLPRDGDPFVRAVAGTVVRPGEDTTLTAEVYLQTYGWGDPLFSHALDDRYLRGELWLHRNGYAGLAVAQQVTPLVSVTGAAFAGVDSALVSATLGWSVAGNAEVGLGGYAGVGARPEAGLPQSEFGTYPYAAFGQMKAYF